MGTGKGGRCSDLSSTAGARCTDTSRQLGKGSTCCAWLQVLLPIRRSHRQGWFPVYVGSLSFLFILAILGDRWARGQVHIAKPSATSQDFRNAAAPGSNGDSSKTLWL